MSILFRPCLIALATMAVGGTAALALPFRADQGDLMLGLRKPGEASELVVNVGSHTNFTGASAGQVVAITNFSRAQLDAAFPDLAGVRFSVSSCVRAGDTNTESLPVQTLWLTRARLSLDEPSAPWVRGSVNGQSPPASRVRAIAVKADSYSRSQLAGPNNTSTLVLIPASSALAYSIQVGTGNLGGSYQGDIENTLLDGFTVQTTPVRSDLFEIRPGSGPGSYLGFFEFRPDGSLWFTAAGGTPELPRLDVTDARVDEGDRETTNLVFSISLSGPTSQAVSLLYATADGSATAGEDYVAQSGLLTFTPGQTNLTVSVPVKGDRQVEPDETLFLRLSSPSNATLGRAQAQGLILNDDQAPPSAPQILSLTRTDGTNRLVFGAGVGVRCSVYFTNSVGLAAPLSRWAVWPAKFLGGNEPILLLDPSADRERFYTISTEP